MDITQMEEDMLVEEINGLTAEFIAMVAEQCATIASTLPAQRIAEGHRDRAMDIGNEIAAAIREQFVPMSIQSALQSGDRMH
jgi:hypothetical protein